MASTPIPEEFVCSITQSIMRNPVSLQCGHTFDREGLENWLNINKVCPTCRKSISESLSVNWSLKSLIEKYQNPNLVNNNTGNQTVFQESAQIADINAINIEEHSYETDLSKVVATYYEKETVINLCLTFPEFKHERRPIAFVCVIDISGSMGSIVGGGEGGKAFTRLDLVKHVLNVLIATLSDKDQLGLITFSDNSEKVLDLVYMTEANKLLAKNLIKQLEQQSSTYTAPAIKLAYELIAKSPKNYINSIILLTDGQDSQGKDIVYRVFDKIEKPPQTQFNTFGFSNDIWSDCLEQLAIKGGGIFGFIPDQSMIGTIFVNFMANMFQVFSQEVLIQLSEGYEFDDSQGKDEKKIVLKYDSSRNFLIKKSSSIFNPMKESNLPLKIKIGLPKQESMIELIPSKVNDENSFNIQMARNLMLKLVLHAKLPDVKLKEILESKYIKAIQDFMSEFKQPPNESSDNNEQIKLSLKNWTTWGQHYIRSFAFAHVYEQCLNFKSPSMNIYRNPKFDQYVDKLTDVFCTLPPPKPSGIDYSKNLPAVSMTRIMNRNSGCILETCHVRLENGMLKMIKDLNKHDILENGSKLVCLIKSKYSGALIKLNNLVITPYHPIYFEDKWQFPIEVYANNMKKVLPNPYFKIIENPNAKTVNVCNLVLENNHIINVENINCVTLGHGFEEDIVKHAYYGTEKVIQDLSKLQGWNDGLVVLNDYRVTRDENTVVTGMIFEEVK